MAKTRKYFGLLLSLLLLRAKRGNLNRLNKKKEKDSER